MQKSSFIKLLPTIFLLLLILFSNLFYQCTRSNKSCEQRLQADLIECMIKPRPPHCPPDTTRYYNKQLKISDTIPQNGYMVHSTITIDSVATKLTYTITIEKIQQH